MFQKIKNNIFAKYFYFLKSYSDFENETVQILKKHKRNENTENNRKRKELHVPMLGRGPTKPVRARVCGASAEGVFHWSAPSLPPQSSSSGVCVAREF